MFNRNNIGYLCLKIIVWTVLIDIVCVAVFGLRNIYLEFNDVCAERNTEKIELYSIETTAEISGSFTLGCGTINNTDYYWCYREVEDGGKQRYKFEVDKTTVYENLQSGDRSYVEVITDGFNHLVECKLYVPENTIMQTTDLSAPN